MQPRHLPRLVVLSCLAATGASAGTVTLLSQERSVGAFIDGPFLDENFDVVEGVTVEDVRVASGFGRFDATAAVTEADPAIPAGVFALDGGNAAPSASQRSSLEAVDGGVAFTASGSADAGNPPAARVANAFLVDFSLDGPTAFELTGSARTFGLFPNDFTFEELGAETVIDLGSFGEFPEVNPSQEQPRVFDFGPGSSRVRTGTLPAGDYRFGLDLGFAGGGTDPIFADFTDFGIVFADSTLVVPGDTPGTPDTTPIPSPAALPAGLALLAGGLLRRRWAA